MSGGTFHHRHSCDDVSGLCFLPLFMTFSSFSLDDVVKNSVDELKDKYITPMLRSAAVLDGVRGSVVVHRVMCSNTHAVHICKYFFATFDCVLDRVCSLTFLEQEQEEEEKKEQKPRSLRTPPQPLRRPDDTPSSPRSAACVEAVLHCSKSSHPQPKREGRASSTKRDDYTLEPTSILLPSVCLFSFLSTCLFFLFFSDSAMCMVKSTAYDARDDRRATEGTGSKCALNQQCSKSSTGFVFHPQTSHQCYRSSYCLLMHWTASPEKLVVKNQDVAREALDILRQHFVLECPVSAQGCQTHKFAAQNLQKPQQHVQISHKHVFTDGRMGWR